MNIKIFLRSIVLLILSGIATNQVMAQKELGIFNSLATETGVSSTGVDVHLTMPVTSHFAIRSGISIMPEFILERDFNVNLYSITSELSPVYTINLKGSFKRTSGGILINYYPFKKSSFFLAGGVCFGGDKIVKIKGHSDELQHLINNTTTAGIVIGDMEIPIDENGNVAGGLKVSNFRPYAGLGFGRAVPKHRISMLFELGAQFHGTPEVYTSQGTLTPRDKNVEDVFTKIIDKLKIYPVIKIHLAVRLF